jgi:hypothetical protein
VFSCPGYVYQNQIKIDINNDELLKTILWHHKRKNPWGDFASFGTLPKALVITINEK